MFTTTLADFLGSLVEPVTESAGVFTKLIMIPLIQIDDNPSHILLMGHLLLIPIGYYLIRAVWGYLFPDVFPVRVVDEDNPVGYQRAYRLYRSGRDRVSRSWLGDRWRSAQYRWDEFQFSRSPGGRRARWSEVYRHRLRGRIHTRNSPGWWRNRGRP